MRADSAALLARIAETSGSGGVSEHAIAFGYGSPSPQWAFPATKSDGNGIIGVDIPEGARIQLDPNLDEADFNALGLSFQAKVIARTMQKYGLILVDVSGRARSRRRGDLDRTFSRRVPDLVRSPTLAGMEPEVFVASRLTSGNHLFPTKLVVDDRVVMRHKRSWLSVNEESIHLRNVATVNITTGIVWSDIRIESSGGSDPLESHGHTKSDARRIKELIENHQARLGDARETDVPPAGETKVCPHCAETIKLAAKVCRYCGRDLA